MFDLGIVSRLCSRYTVNELSVLAESQTFLLFFFSSKGSFAKLILGCIEVLHVVRTRNIIKVRMEGLQKQ